jgi:tetratricopeptide (TPR) repeat protein
VPDARLLLNEGRRSQQIGALERALDCFRQAIEETDDLALAAEGWRRVSSVHRTRCDWQAALEAVHRSRALLRAVDDPNALAETLNAEAAIHINRGEFGVARPLLEEATELARSDRALGITLQNLGFVSARTGDLDGAERYFQVSAAHFHRAGYRWGEACVLGNHAAVALDRQDYKLADATAERAMEVAREVEDLNLLAMATMNRAEAQAALGNFGRAEDLASEALGYFGAADHSLQVQVYRLLGDISVKRGDSMTARRCYEKGLEMARRMEVQLESRELSARLGEMAAPESRVGAASSAGSVQHASPEAPPPA